MTVDWYDLLDVPRDADSATIRAAWKAAVADLDPTDRTFRVHSQAAEVLLDPDKRAAYDASLADADAAAAASAAQEPSGTPDRPADQPSAPVQPASPAGETADAAETAGTGRGSGWQPPVWLLAGLALLTVATTVFGFVWRERVPSDDQIDEAATSAQSAAEKAVVDVLAYDYRDLEKSRDAAVAHMTDDYREDKYAPLFTVVEDNAAEVKPVVTVKVVGSAVTRSADERATILLFFDRQTTNKATTKPRATYDQATLTMALVDGTWLVDDIKSS